MHFVFVCEWHLVKIAVGVCVKVMQLWNTKNNHLKLLHFEVKHTGSILKRVSGQ